MTKPRICGKRGKPIYVMTGFKNQFMSKGILDMRLHIGANISTLKDIRMRIGPTMWRTVGLPPDTFLCWRGGCVVK